MTPRRESGSLENLIRRFQWKLSLKRSLGMSTNGRIVLIRSILPPAMIAILRSCRSGGNPSVVKLVKGAGFAPITKRAAFGATIAAPTLVF